MQTEQPWYIGLRSEALAIVYLTRNHELIVYRDKNHYGLDILVSISQNGKDINRLFGVEVKAIKSTSKIIQNEEVFTIEGANINVLQSRFVKCQFPICLFFFTLDNDNGYYKWIIEPIIDKKNSNNLELNPNPEFRKLTTQAINDIVSLVNQWYENKSTDSVSVRYKSKLLNELKEITQNNVDKNDLENETKEVKS